MSVMPCVKSTSISVGLVCGDVSFVEENISKGRLVRVAARQHMGKYAKRIWIIDQRAVEVMLNFIPSSVLCVGWFDECASAVSRKVNIAQTMRAKKPKTKTTHLSTDFITTHKSENPTPLPSLLRIFDSPLPNRHFLSVTRLPVKTAKKFKSTPHRRRCRNICQSGSSSPAPSVRCCVEL